ncbi:MAG: hypothetical protein QOJ99_381 [Bryobacterales bacterium]|nr:hypothetical protein [Bryobacterales bacterium]
MAEPARSFFEAYHAHDVNRMLMACSADAQVRYVPMGSQGRARPGDRPKDLDRSHQCISGSDDHYSVDIQSILSDGRDVAAEVVIGGTQRKDFLRIRSQGRHYELPHAFLVQVDSGGMITRITAYQDNASFIVIPVQDRCRGAAALLNGTRGDGSV